MMKAVTLLIIQETELFPWINEIAGWIGYRRKFQTDFPYLLNDF